MIALQKDDPTAYYHMGEIYYFLDNWKYALDAFEQSRALGGNAPQLDKYLKFLNQSKNSHSPVASAAASAEVVTSSAASKARSGTRSTSYKKPTTSVKAASERSTSAAASARVVTSSAISKARPSETRSSSYKKPTKAESFYNHGVNLTKKRGYSEGLDALKRAKKLGFNSIELYYYIAYNLHKLGRNTDALNVCKYAIRLLSKDGSRSTPCFNKIRILKETLLSLLKEYSKEDSEEYSPEESEECSPEESEEYSSADDNAGNHHSAAKPAATAVASAAAPAVSTKSPLATVVFTTKPNAFPEVPVAPAATAVAPGVSTTSPLAPVVLLTTKPEASAEALIATVTAEVSPAASMASSEVSTVLKR